MGVDLNRLQERFESEAYENGRLAFREDRGVDDCIYIGRIREAWEQGYADAREEEYEARKAMNNG